MADESVSPAGTGGCLIIIAIVLFFSAYSFDFSFIWIICAILIFIIGIILIVPDPKNSNSEHESNHNTNTDSEQQSEFEKFLPAAKEAANNLYQHICRMNHSEKIRAVLAEKINITNEDEGGKDFSVDNDENRLYTNLDNRVAFSAINDVQKCYEHLGHGVNLRSIESLPVAIFFTQIVVPDKVYLWEFYNGNEIYSIAEESYECAKKYYRPHFDKDKFLLVEALRDTDAEQDLVDKYVVLLYRFAMTIANADKNIDETEKQWLANILKFNDTTSSNDNESTEKNENALDDLNTLIGLTSVKSEVQNIYNLIKVQKIREASGLKAPDISYHCVFTGNPGTGKTTVARVVAQIYQNLGILKKGQLIETDRSGLVAEYVGQTAVKTNKIIDSALDGVLFIDEAYSLIQGGNNDYGMEAVATLLKRMEDDRDRLVVILAGYSDEMKQFINSNPGLQSRFNRYINFEDYNVDELMSIFCFNLQKYDYVMTAEGRAHLQKVLDEAVAHKDENFGNARYVRNLFEKTLEKQAQRLAFAPSLTNDDLKEITADDIPNLQQS